MPRLRHGTIISIDDMQQAQAALADLSIQSPTGFAVAPIDLHDFDFLFPELQNDPANLLPEDLATNQGLRRLGRAMEDPGGPDPGNSQIPAVYTYFGQFVDHDITFETQSGGMGDIFSNDLPPLPLAVLRDVLKNTRTATLELDSLYGNPAPRDPANTDKMLIGLVTELNSPTPPTSRPPGKGLDNDLPREEPSPDPAHDRAALIGDPRNDENLIVAQLHVAFLKAHNALVDQGRSFEEARRILRQHYQHIVIDDYLRKICKSSVYDEIVQNGNKVFNPLAEPFFMPYEFSVAAFRFGHTMIRGAYNFNVNFTGRNGPDLRPATLHDLFTFTALSGPLFTKTLPENWIIQWENVVDTGAGDPFDRARKFDTKLAGHSSDDEGEALALFKLTNTHGQMEQPPDAARLSVRNLLRGYRLRMPTGQAVAQRLGLTPMTPAEIEAAAGSPAQVQALQEGGFLERTPLWYYILAEAQHEEAGERLGTIGSIIVAEVLYGLVYHSDDSILRQPGWTPSLPGAQPGKFELADLLRFAGVLADAPPAVRTYTVQSGDSLFSIAQQELGDGSRWPEIFALNRAVIRDPSLIFPGQVLILPPDGPAVPAPRFYVVQPGDTLSGIALQELGDENRSGEIFNLNRDVISNPDIIFPGQVLVLPN